MGGRNKVQERNGAKHERLRLISHSIMKLSDDFESYFIEDDLSEDEFDQKNIDAGDNSSGDEE